jgi:hypothetical protein
MAYPMTVETSIEIFESATEATISVYSKVPEAAFGKKGEI